MAKKEKYYKRKDGLYEAIRTINGKRVAFRGKTCREVDRKMLEYHEEAEKGPTVKEVAEKWLEHKDGRVSQQSAEVYAIYVQKLIDAIGTMRVSEVSPILCQRIMEGMAGQGYNLGTAKLQKSVLMQVFRYAVIQGFINISPAAEIEMPRGLARNQRSALTPEQIKAVTECRGGDWWLLGLAFLWTGCRRGEMLALRYEDIDRKAGTIAINKKVVHTNGKAILETHTKTDAGMRTIPLLAPLANALPKGRIGLIFHNKDGEHLKPSEFTRAWKEYRAEVGLPEHITPHYFRHTFATICYDAGVDPKQAADMLGHANESITMELYTHLTSDKRSAAASKMEEYAATKISAAV